MGCFSSDTKPKEAGLYGHIMPQESQEALKFALNKGGEEALVSQLLLHISCRKLKNVDVGSLTDSACILYMKDKRYAGE